jgi:hypothetical protein
LRDIFARLSHRPCLGPKSLKAKEILGLTRNCHMLATLGAEDGRVACEMRAILRVRVSRRGSRSKAHSTIFASASANARLQTRAPRDANQQWNNPVMGYVLLDWCPDAALHRGTPSRHKQRHLTRRETSREFWG